MDKAVKGLIDEINKELGTEVVTINDLNIWVKYEDKIDYACICNDEDELYNTLSDMLDGIKIAKTVFKK